MNSVDKTIGILALQGDFDAHRKTLANGLQVATQLVRTADDLSACDALVLPGGESTTIIKLLQRIGLDTAIVERARAGMPVFGTCAGMILLAQHIEDRPEQPTLGLLPITVARNAFGRQIDSFEADVPFAAEGAESQNVRGVFIRAPFVTQADSEVAIVSRYEEKIVGVRHDNLLAVAFHPELTDDTRLHSYFVRMVEKAKETR